jgi:hypothetical protein
MKNQVVVKSLRRANLGCEFVGAKFHPRMPPKHGESTTGLGSTISNADQEKSSKLTHQIQARFRKGLESCKIDVGGATRSSENKRGSFRVRVK